MTGSRVHNEVQVVMAPATQVAESEDSSHQAAPGLWASLITLGGVIPVPGVAYRCSSGGSVSAEADPSAGTLLGSQAEGGGGAQERREKTKPRVYLGGRGVLSCCNCRAHLASRDHVVSKCFQGRSGRAYLLERCVNVTAGPREERVLITGLHTVADIFCACCQAVLGWKYESALEPTQKYKVGKFILERSKLLQQDEM